MEAGCEIFDTWSDAIIEGVFHDKFGIDPAELERLDEATLTARYEDQRKAERDATAPADASDAPPAKRSRAGASTGGAVVLQSEGLPILQIPEGCSRSSVGRSGESHPRLPVRLSGPGPSIIASRPRPGA